jgi:hypothetical protein
MACVKKAAKFGLICAHGSELDSLAAARNIIPLQTDYALSASEKM